MSNAQRLTRKQSDILGVVDECGPVTASQIGGYHLPISNGSARSALRTLEERGLIAAVHTGRSQRGRAFVLTRQGAAALEAEHGRTPEVGP
jgi:predicted ArsR family transcriptional regulator